VIFSDRTMKEALAEKRIQVDPLVEANIQPSSIDVRVDSYFRTFQNHRYPFIDPRTPQPDLTTQVEADGDTPFMLHPSEFVLGSTLEVVSLSDDVVARLARSPHPFHRRFHRPGVLRPHHSRAIKRGHPPDRHLPRYEDRPDFLL